MQWETNQCGFKSKFWSFSSKSTEGMEYLLTESQLQCTTVSCGRERARAAVTDWHALNTFVPTRTSRNRCATTSRNQCVMGWR
eukprot:1263337-Rhodomonas_salina.1